MEEHGPLLIVEGLGLRLFRAESDFELLPLKITPKFLCDQITQKKVKFCILRGQTDQAFRAIRDGLVTPTHSDFYSMPDRHFKTMPSGCVKPSAKKAKTSPTRKPP